jgi:5-(carboxyamino)imidazole ribonucleotide mutase
MKKIDVAIIMGSKSDWPVMKEAVKILKEFKIKFKAEVVSAHRTPKEMVSFAKKAEVSGLKLIIAGAGGAAHLPGMVASLTPLPVIGVPIMSKKLKGLDSLLSIAQMPKGVPVATVAIDNAANAALLAVRILSVVDKKMNKKLKESIQKMRKEVKKHKLS